jgi:hypothetical protein
MTGVFASYLHPYYTYYMTGLFAGYLHPYYTYCMTDPFTGYLHQITSKGTSHVYV